MSNHLIKLPCGHKVTERTLLSLAGRVQAARRTNFPNGGKRNGAGRPKKLTPDQVAHVRTSLTGVEYGDKTEAAMKLAEQYGVSLWTILKARGKGGTTSNGDEAVLEVPEE